MTRSQYELGDHDQTTVWQDHAEPHLALLDDSGMLNPIKRTAYEQSGPVISNRVQAPTEVERQVDAAVQTYLAAPDKAVALAKLAPKFEEAIKTSDMVAQSKLNSMRIESRTLRPAYDKAMKNVDASVEKMQGEFMKVPPAERPKVLSLLTAYSMLDQKDPLRAEMEKGLVKKHPALIHSVDELETAMKDPSIRRVEELKEQAQTAADDRALTRFIYANVLRQNGQEHQADRYEAEGSEILGLPVEKKKQLKSA